VKWSALSLIALLSLGPIIRALPTSATNSSALAGMEHKLNRIESNARSPHPDQTPTVFTEQEVNSYLASDEVELPAGVESVTLQGEPGTITGNARVDFDRIRAGVRSSNPLLSIFSGVHDVVVATHAYGAGGQGYVHVDSVSLDGVGVPRFLLQLFVEKYLQPKYPQLGLDSRFSLPDRIDTATVGQHRLTVTQK
jgi:hypothetical protein